MYFNVPFKEQNNTFIRSPDKDYEVFMLKCQVRKEQLQ